jgi:hypothetical protein
MSASMPKAPSLSETPPGNAGASLTLQQTAPKNKHSAPRAACHEMTALFLASWASSATGLAICSILLALAAALGLAFWLYAQPEVVVMLAEQLWACF